ncbi:MAG: hypothetical protein WCD76_05605 [Pyrinomonadaceae bacterium]
MNETEENELNETEGLDKAWGGVTLPSELESPNEKLEGQPPAGSTLPGVENPESEEVKKEINPNTE